MYNINAAVFLRQLFSTQSPKNGANSPPFSTVTQNNFKILANVIKI